MEEIEGLGLFQFGLGIEAKKPIGKTKILNYLK